MESMSMDGRECSLHDVRGHQIRHARPDDWPRLIEINEAEVQHTSAMDTQRLDELDALSDYHKVAELDGSVAGFLIAMREGVHYDNANYTWFSARYPEFLYVDRIVVESGHRGLGSLLYADLFAHAISENVSIVCCEYNLEPPNEPSRRFHDKFGFAEVGTQWVMAGSKNVSMQIARPSEYDSGTPRPGTKRRK